MALQLFKQKLIRIGRIILYLWNNLFYLFSGLVLAALTVLGLGWLITKCFGMHGWVADAIMITYTAIISLYILFKITQWVMWNYKRHFKRNEMTVNPIPPSPDNKISNTKTSLDIQDASTSQAF